MNEQGSWPLKSGLLLILALGLTASGLPQSVLRALAPLAGPFLWAGVLALAMYAPLCLLEENLPFPARRLRQAAALVLVLIGLGALVLLVVFAVLPQLMHAGGQLLQALPGLQQKAMGWLRRALGGWPQAEQWLEQLLAQARPEQLLPQQLTPFLNGTMDLASDVGTAALDFGLGLVLACYLLACRQTLCEQLTRLIRVWLPSAAARRLLWVGRITRTAFLSFLSGQCLEACILGIMFTAMLAVCRMPYPLLIGVVIAFTALLPVIGSFLGCAVGALLIFVQSPGRALWFVVLFLCLQQIEGALVYPRIVGQRVGLPPLWIFVAVVVGGRLFGFFGILLFIPLSSVAYTLLRAATRQRERGREGEA